MTEHVEGGGSASSTTKIVLIIVGVVAGVLLLTCAGLFIISSALTLPALGMAQERAMALRSATQLRHIEMSIDIAARDEDGNVGSLDELIQRGYVTPELATSPRGPIGDGRGDYWIDFDRPDWDDLDDPAIYIISYDRFMYAHDRLVPVCMLDGNCDVLAFDEFEALLAAPGNDGRDFNLPQRIRPGE